MRVQCLGRAMMNAYLPTWVVLGINQLALAARRLVSRPDCVRSRISPGRAMDRDIAKLLDLGDEGGTLAVRVWFRLAPPCYLRFGLILVLG